MNRTLIILRVIAVCVLIISIIVTIGAALKGKPVETSLIALLPPSDRDPVVDDAANRYAEKMGRSLVFLVKADSKEQSIQAAAQLERALRRHPDLFKKVTGQISQARMKDYYDTFFPWRWQILSSENSRRVMRHQGDVIIQDALDTLYSPVSGPGIALFKEDPLFLFSSFMRHLPRLSGKFTVEDGYLLNTEGKITRILVTAETSLDPFDTGYQKHALRAIDSASREIEVSSPNVSLLWTGMLKYAQKSAATAQREISIIGIGSMLGIALLIVLAFRSWKVLILGIVPICLGLVAAYATTYLVFGAVHMLTLVFGATLLGVSIDYSLHYFSDLRFGTHSKDESVIRRILPGITLGMITSILGFLCLLIAPFPGIRQMALFSATGLFVAWGVVVLLFPMLNVQLPANGRVLPRIISSYLQLADRATVRKAVSIVLIVAGIAAIPGVFLLEFNDDIRLLQNQNSVLNQEEKEISLVLGSFDKNRFLLIEGETPDTLLRREELITSILRRLIKEEILGNFIAISSLIPSTSRQQSNGTAMRTIAKSSEARAFARTIDEPAIFNSLENAPFQKKKYLTPDAVLNRPALEPYRNLWIGKTARGYASLIMLEDIRNPDRFTKLINTLDDVHYVDRVERISHTFAQYRHISSWLAVGAYFVILLLLMFRYGPIAGFRVFLPSVITAMILLGFMGFAAIPANLFTFMALLMTLGISIDYTIFFAEAREHQVSAGIGVLVASITTILSFGLLSLSETPALHSFGFVVLFGISLAAALSPIGRIPNKGR